ncbi:Virion phosphoprotein [Sea otter poxvirus]|uniref:Assembly protein G7 n=1 Tax=Sea otter poxvirus TaxID=1416741 RepID=A0A2U9QHQ6_9POXV|nr:Virion phosphoprotein [Sea otter poxvirus]AWU47102.1 Virion phosphoprotein [Sea otter poxvirus]
MIDEQRSSFLFNNVSCAIIRSVTKGLIANTNTLEKLAKSLYSCDSHKRDQAISAIYSKCESDIRVDDINTLQSILKTLRPYSIYVCDHGEFWRLYGSLERFTHNSSFFKVCHFIVLSTLAALITLILSNQLFYAMDIVEVLEQFLFKSQKQLSQDLHDLLHMKYAIINLIQYRMFPDITGNRISTVGGYPIDCNTSLIHQEAERLLSLPVKCDAINNMYNYLTMKGITIENNHAEFMAGLKIEEMSTVDNIQNSQQLVIVHPQANKLTQQKNIINKAEQHYNGTILDGRVSSPLGTTDNKFIQLSDSELNKFAILEYLYTLRVLASSIKTKLQSDTKGITFNINSPFRVVTVPTKITDALTKQVTKTSSQGTIKQYTRSSAISS